MVLLPFCIIFLSFFLLSLFSLFRSDYASLHHALHPLETTPFCLCFFIPPSTFGWITPQLVPLPRPPPPLPPAFRTSLPFPPHFVSAPTTLLLLILCTREHATFVGEWRGKWGGAVRERGEGEGTLSACFVANGVQRSARLGMRAAAVATARVPLSDRLVGASSDACVFLGNRRVFEPEPDGETEWFERVRAFSPSRKRDNETRWGGVEGSGTRRGGERNRRRGRRKQSRSQSSAKGA